MTFSYLNDKGLGIFFKSNIENVKGKTHEFKKKFGVNKNISSLCFLIVCGFTQVLVIIESVIVKKKGGICELMMISMDSRKISAF